mgnify:CR=1 FL=1
MKSKIIKLRDEYLSTFNEKKFGKSKFAIDYPDIIAWAQSEKGKALTNFAVAHCETRIEIIEKVEKLGKELPIFRFFTRTPAHTYISQILILNTLQQLALPELHQTKFGLPQKSVYELVSNKVSLGTFNNIIKQAVEFGFLEKRVSVVDSRSVILVPSAHFVTANIAHCAAIGDIINESNFIEKYTFLINELKNRRVPTAIRDLVKKYCNKTVSFFDKS